MSNAKSAEVQPLTSPLPRSEGRRPWVVPSIVSLPRLTELTLLSPIGGGGGTGGSTVFGLLLAAGLLFGIGACSDEVVRPSTKGPAAEIQTVSCRADIKAGTIDCAGPSRSGAVILGGQGSRVALRSTNVGYNGGTQIFSATVTVQNLLAQTIGSDGLGVNVFFESGPSVTGGTGIVAVANPTGTNGTFDGTNQTFFNFPDSLQTGQISSPLVWQWNVPNTVTTFSFTVLVSATLADDQGVLSWSAVPQFQSDSFTDIAVNSATDAMAVGPAGVAYRKVGSVWSPLPVQLHEDWVGVAAIGDGEYVGATAQGSVALYKGGVWRTIRAAGFNIEGVTAYAENRIAIGGDSGGSPRLSWLGDNGWFSIGLGGGSTFRYAASYDFDQGVGATLDGSVYRFNFNSVTVSGTSASPITAFYGAISASDFGKAIFSGGFAGIVDDASLNVYNGGADTIVDAVDFGSGGPNWWAAVRNTITDSSRLMSFTLGAWTDRALLPQPVVKMVQDSTGGLYLLSADGIRRWNGSAVVNELVAPSGTPTALGAAGNVLFVGTSTGQIWRYASGSWISANVGCGPIEQLAVWSATRAYAIDLCAKFYNFDGVTWDTSASSYATPIAGLVALGTDDAVWAGGSGPTSSLVQHWHAGTASPDFVAGHPWRGVWGTDPGNFWVVSPGGLVHQWTGAFYVDHSLADTTRTLSAVSGTSASDVWAGDTTGALYWWNGASWSSCPAIVPFSITTLWSPQAGEVYVGGASGKVYAATSACAVHPMTISAGGGAVSQIFGSGPSGVWALVGTGIFHGTR